jgi:hypothetical protein
MTAKDFDRKGYDRGSSIILELTFEQPVPFDPDDTLTLFDPDNIEVSILDATSSVITSGTNTTVVSTGKHTFTFQSGREWAKGIYSVSIGITAGEYQDYEVVSDAFVLE